MDIEELGMPELKGFKLKRDMAFNVFKAAVRYRTEKKDHDLNNRVLKTILAHFSQSQRELATLNQQMYDTQQELESDLKVAAGIQASLLPQAAPDVEQLKFAWKFFPCQSIGGDIFNVFRLDEDHMGLYILDVSGHGVPSALVTVSVSQRLNAQNGMLVKRKQEDPPRYRITPPSEVLQILDEEYPMERFDKYFTAVYLVINFKTGHLTYSNAAHPAPVLLHPDRDYTLLREGGTIVGMGGVLPFDEETLELQSGDKLILYTDGMTESKNEEGEFYGDVRLQNFLEANKNLPIAELLTTAHEHMMAFGKHMPLTDDITMLGVEFV
ncbi:PP2C family protein-serine/threonine phosphatase [Desulfoluna sp.]|uniref:PP2C family protein-serine/threonine phosphatase n=1 Tax=Desulfoluna sp. TaxID=2045199 RepID=UPI0026166041|nr:PP2C family protein-serine/threonine phosphatase [Desulfoluna sp.]